jgi:hypothetical protein
MAWLGHLNRTTRRRGMVNADIHAIGSPTIQFDGFGLVSMPYPICQSISGT